MTTETSVDNQGSQTTYSEWTEKKTSTSEDQDEAVLVKADPPQTYSSTDVQGCKTIVTTITENVTHWSQTTTFTETVKETTHYATYDETVTTIYTTVYTDTWDEVETDTTTDTSYTC
jgi:hypothetical protein